MQYTNNSIDTNNTNFHESQHNNNKSLIIMNFKNNKIIDKV